MLQKVPRIFAAMTLSACAAMGQADKPPAPVVAGIPVNYDEARVGTYTLPDPLLLANGKPVRDAKTWNEKRRPEIVRLFEENQYGREPGPPGRDELRRVRQGHAGVRRQRRCAAR